MDNNILAVQEMEQALLAAGWKNIHATPFWKSPSGFKASSVSHAYESMKAGADIIKKEHCPTCGQEIS